MKEDRQQRKQSERHHNLDKQVDEDDYIPPDQQYPRVQDWPYDRQL